MSKRFLETLSEVLVAVAEAAAEDRKRDLAMAIVDRNTQFLDNYAKNVVMDFKSMKTTVYDVRRQIVAMRLSDDEKTYLKRRLISEASASADYYAKMNIDHLLRAI